MKFALLLSWLALSCVIPVRAADATKSFLAREAQGHFGETVTITGKVDGVRTLDSGMTLVNLDGRYPGQSCTLVVRPKHAKTVGDLSGFVGKTIAVTGVVTDYKGRPQVEITKRDAITETK